MRVRISHLFGSRTSLLSIDTNRTKFAVAGTRSRLAFDRIEWLERVGNQVNQDNCIVIGQYGTGDLGWDI